jgi:hypothetical protein
MESLEEVLKRYEKHVYTKLSTIQHTHPPIRGIQKNCLYCQVHGNVFENGVTMADSRLHTFIVPMVSSLQMS